MVSASVYRSLHAVFGVRLAVEYNEFITHHRLDVVSIGPLDIIARRIKQASINSLDML